MTTTAIPVLTERLAECRKELERLAKKARRYGCPDIRVTVGETRVETRQVTDWDGSTRKVRVSVTDLVVEGEAPRYGNHEFLARVELGGAAGNMVDTRPDVEDLDPRFRHTDGTCQHCNTLRDRREVFVCRDLTTGEQVQVGRQCLRDYLGIDDPNHVAARFRFFRELGGLREKGGWSWAQSLEGLLELAAVSIRLFGWCSKGQAAIDETLTPTASYVSLGLQSPAKVSKLDRPTYNKIHEALCDDDRATAREVIRWVREELTGRSDYEHNLRVMFQEDVITDPRRVGLVVSAVAAHARAKERELRRTRERAASQWLGQVGERLRGLLVTQESARVVGELVLLKFRDEAGNVLTWFTGSGSGLQNGEQCRLDGTVKRHTEYQGVHETRLSRCRIHPIK